MHRNVKRAAAKTLALALVLSVAGGSAPDSQAAKKPKLSTNKVTVTVGKSKKVKIKNVTKNKVKSLKVKSSKTKIATAKASGKTALTVTGKKKGTAKVTAKVTLKGKKKATTLTLKVTVKKVTPPTPSDTPATTAPATSAPATSAPATTTPPANGGDQTTPPAGDGNQTTPPAGTTPPSGTDNPDDTSPKPQYTAMPNAGEKRIKHTSDIENPVINNISIWGLRDNPYAESGYDYSQYGPFSGLFTKWYEPKESFKAVHELFNPTVSQSLASMRLRAVTESGSDAEGGDAPLYTVGDTGETVKSIVTTSKLNWDTQAYTNEEQHSVDFVSRTSTSNKDQRVTVVDGVTLEETDSGNEPAVLVSGRANNWHGIQIDITDFMTDPTKDYRLSMDITHNTASHNSHSFYTQIAYLDEDGNESDDRPMLVQGSTSAGKWKTYAANFSINGSTASRFVLFVNWYGNTTTHDDFYIKNVTVSEISSDQDYDTTEILAYSPLYQNTEKKYGFTLGGVIGNAAFKEANYKDVLGRHFSSMTVDNDLKMYSMLDETATKASEDGMPVLRKNGSGEEMVKWAYENGIGVRGHTIVCDTAMDTNCKYFFCVDYDTSKGLASREVVLKRLESFITQCITYFEEKYPGTIYTWDVVNEAIEPGKVTVDGKSVNAYADGDDRKVQKYDNMFYSTIGGDYVEYSFLYARQAVNTLKEMYPDRDINIQLFYNDFNCYESSKRNAIVNLVKSIQAFGNERGMGNLIDGIGMQCYLGSTGAGASGQSDELLQTINKRTANSIPNAVFMFNDLGCKVQFTELTIRNYGQKEDATKSAVDTPAERQAQAAYYRKFMQMAIDINNGTMQKELK